MNADSADIPAAAAEWRRAGNHVGLAIGALTPFEIAISILAEIIAMRRGVTPPRRGSP